MTDPRKDAQPAFPSFGQAAVIVMVLFLLESIALILVSAALEPGADQISAAGSIALVLANGALLTLILHHKQMGYGALFHASPSSVRATLGLLLAPVALLVPALVLANTTLGALLARLFPPTRYQLEMFAQLTAPDLMQIITVCLLAPFLEEMLFRGVMLRSFLRQYTRKQALLGSALLFGAAHMNLYQFAGGVLIGLVLGWLYDRSRSLWPCIALHALYNGAILLLVRAYDNDDSALAAAFSLPVWVLAFLAACAGAALLLRMLGGRRGIEGSKGRD